MKKKSINYLKTEIAPIMRTVEVGNIDEMQWAVNIINLSNVRRSSNDELFEAMRDRCIEKIKQLPLTLKDVKKHKKTIQESLQPTFWDTASEARLDEIIHNLGPLMKHRDSEMSAIRIFDISDSIRIRTWLDLDGKSVPKTKYQEIVTQFISGLAEQSAAVRKVRDGEMVSADEIQEISLLFEGCEHPISVDNLRAAWGAKRVKLEEFLALILRGEELPDWETKVRGDFDEFIQEHSTFNARQIEMLNALCNYVIDNEAVARPALVAAPFTQFDRRGFPGVFKTDQINEILSFTEALTA